MTLVDTNTDNEKIKSQKYMKKLEIVTQEKKHLILK